MSKRRRKPQKRQTAVSNAEPEAFTFGAPEPVLNRYDFLYNGCWQVNARYYEPPVDLAALAKMYRATAHHGSALQVKRNILLRTFQPTKWLRRSSFTTLALDYLVLGNCYTQQVHSRLGSLLEVRPALARYVRVGVQPGTFWWVHHWSDETEFDLGSIAHLKEPDLNQEVYGVPDYLGALQSVMLNEGATLFRRKYYENGSHAGFILYMTDAAHKQEDVDNLRQALRDAKGPGNFRNLFMYAPNGKKDGIQILPVSEVAAKDDFWNIKNVSRDDQLAGHRVPPQLMGIIPANTGGFGDVEKAAKVFVANELEPLQERLLELNDLVGEEVIKWRPYSLGVESDNH
ncbi:phage portal protein [Marinimicrobium sp. ARAG 43.8]|uniref:phage portal protein n=1 Tax=Marinimicrobium sp. ARAG 43.8 TaxID=3418719 RepID=UPI003CF353D4